MIKKEFTTTETKNRVALLVGLNIDKSEERFSASMKELEQLAEACSIEISGTMTQNSPLVNKATFIGSGKTEELKNTVKMLHPDLVIFNETLSPMQIRNLDRILDTEIMDRTGLILEIFTLRARTREAVLQVESARLAYMLPRLAGMRNELGRQGGTSGSMSNKGLGEKKIELDRRYIEKRISEIEKELKKIDRERDTQRSRRLRSGELKVALVGYTNAGKSTVMNAFLSYAGGKDRRNSSSDGTIAPGAKEVTAKENREYVREGKEVFEADMLFATLDTTVRRIEAPDVKPFMLIDTVGFIDELPHSLVKAFRSTLEEVKYADLILEVIDYADEEYKNHMEVTGKTLAEIGAGAIPVIYVYNKYDKVIDALKEMLPEYRIDKTVGKENEIPVIRDESIYLSAKKGQGIPELIRMIDAFRQKGEVEWTALIPYTRGDILSYLNANASVLSMEYIDEGTRVKVRTSKVDMERYREVKTIDE